MSKAILREHFEQIWNNKDASGIERFIAPNYRGFDGAELISGIEGYNETATHYPPRGLSSGGQGRPRPPSTGGPAAPAAWLDAAPWQAGSHSGPSRRLSYAHPSVLD